MSNINQHLLTKKREYKSINWTTLRDVPPVDVTDSLIAEMENTVQFLKNILDVEQDYLNELKQLRSTVYK